MTELRSGPKWRVTVRSQGRKTEQKPSRKKGKIRAERDKERVKIRAEMNSDGQVSGARGRTKAQCRQRKSQVIQKGKYHIETDPRKVSFRWG
jgi:hypothetical protein